MILWFFLPTLFFVFDMLVYFLLGYCYAVTTLGFLFFSMLGCNVAKRVQFLALFYALLQASVVFGTTIIVLVFFVGVKFFFKKMLFFLKDGPMLCLVMSIFCMVCYGALMNQLGFIWIKNYTSISFFATIGIISVQILFLNSIYQASGQGNRLCKARGKSGHQTGNVPFDKIRTGNKYC